jgi:hypothetical protein
MGLLKATPTQIACFSSERISAQSIGHNIQKKIFLELPLEPLARRYAPIERANEVSGIVILRPEMKANAKISLSCILDDQRARDLLRDAIASAPLHYAPFWQGDSHDIQRQRSLADEIVTSVQDLPPIFYGTGSFPLGSIASLIRKRVVQVMT